MTDPTSMTAQQIAGQLRREDLSAPTLQELMHSITARRREIKSRLARIEGANSIERRAATAAADMSQLAALNREAESLDDECGVLCDLESRVIQRHTAATDRETLEAARQGRKKLAALTDAAARALARYQDARRQLDTVLGALAGARDLLRGNQRAREELEVSGADFELIATAMDLSTAGARAGLRQRVCAPAPPVYSDGPPDLAAQVRDIMSPFARRDRGL